jgi:ubiquinone/menaquinone biosynthesis C-methylase UbiE
MPNHDYIYSNEAIQYERLISMEDYEGNIIRTITNIVPHLHHAEVVDLGAGTGRLSCLLAPRVKSIIAADLSESMLAVAADKLRALGASNWRTLVADNKTLSLPDHSVDLITAGWTICYSASSNVEEWQSHLDAIMLEMQRVLRPNGTVIIFENFGTGNPQPDPPAFLKSYYRLLEDKYGFSHTYIRTDFCYPSVAEAVDLCRFFFGDELAERVADAQSRIVPECTGVWWKLPH